MLKLKISTTAIFALLLVALFVAPLSLANTDASCIGIAEGSTFVAADGCNSCTCFNGIASCTELACEAAPVTGPIAPQCIATQRPATAVLYENFCAASSTFVSSLEEVVGCVDLDAICPMQITYARNQETGLLYAFSSGCIPEGFVRSNVVTQCPASSQCLESDRTVYAKIIVDACAADAVSSALNVAVGCVASDSICPQAITYGRRSSDASSTVFIFSSGCMPEGFEIVSDSSIVNCLNAVQEQSNTEIVCTASEHSVKAYDAVAVCQIDMSHSAPLVMETVGCLDANMACSGSMSFATDMTTGKDYLFMDACLPLNFQTITASCSEINTRATCRNTNTRPVRATPVTTFCADPTNAFSENTPDQVNAVTVGCVSTSSICLQQTTFARSVDGQVYVFADSCLPEGYEVVVNGQCSSSNDESVCTNGNRAVYAQLAKDACLVDGATSSIDTESNVFVGCLPQAQPCLMMQTFARSAADNKMYVFADTCLPDGFITDDSVRSCADALCSVLECSTNGRVCATRTAEDSIHMEAFCSAPECVGQQIDAEFFIECNSCVCDVEGRLLCTKRRCPPTSGPVVPQCIATQRPVEAVSAFEVCGDSGEATNKAGTALEAVGCIDLGAMCLMQTTYAVRDSDKRVFVFGTSCVPEGFRVLPGVNSCDSFACANAECAEGTVCIPNVVECFTTPCMMEAVCAAPQCSSHRVNEEFVLAQPMPNMSGSFLCNVDCVCLTDGSLQCSPCPTASPATLESDSSSSAAIYAAGGFGVAAAAVGVFVGYKKYNRRADKQPLIPTPNYKSFVSTNV